MNNLQDKFDQSVIKIENASLKLNNNMLLELYAFYKQSTIGNINITCPNSLKVKQRAQMECLEIKGISYKIPSYAKIHKSGGFSFILDPDVVEL